MSDNLGDIKTSLKLHIEMNDRKTKHEMLQFLVH